MDISPDVKRRHYRRDGKHYAVTMNDGSTHAYCHAIQSRCATKDHARFTYQRQGDPMCGECSAELVALARACS